MKSLALIVALILHACGLWSHLPAHTRTNLATSATGGDAVTDPPAAINLPAIALPPLPVRTTTATLNLNATSAIAVDAATGTVLFAQNAQAKRPIASITKMTTTLVILGRHGLDETVKIPTLPNYQPEDERIGLIPGETYTVGDLVKAALINSANDAADALAIWDAGSTTKFAARMNAKMAEWGITGAHFSNPTGLQDSGNYATAEALAHIAGLAIANPTIRDVVSQSGATITSGAGRALNLQTTDDLLYTGQFYGIKTGYTLIAGECFVGLTRIAGHEVITVVLDAGSRFGATQTLANWIGQSWQWL